MHRKETWFLCMRQNVQMGEKNKLHLAHGKILLNLLASYLWLLHIHNLSLHQAPPGWRLLVGHTRPSSMFSFQCKKWKISREFWWWCRSGSYFLSSNTSGSNLLPPLYQSSDSANHPQLKAKWSPDLSVSTPNKNVCWVLKAITSSRRSQCRAIRKNNSGRLHNKLAASRSSCVFIGLTVQKQAALLTFYISCSFNPTPICTLFANKTKQNKKKRLVFVEPITSSTSYNTGNLTALAVADDYCFATGS